MPATPRDPSAPDDVVKTALGRAARAGGPDCPDAEALAAYYERALDRAELARCEAHVASCLACQQRLAALVRSEVATGVEDEEAASATASWWRRRAASPWRWAWVAPALAAGLVVIVWLAERPAPIPAPELTLASRSAAPAEPAALRDRRRPPRRGCSSLAPSRWPPLPKRTSPPAPAPAAQADTAAAAAGREAAKREPAAEARAPAGAAGRNLAAGTAQGGVGATAEKSAERKAKALATPGFPLVLMAPGGQVAWRLTTNGAIARSDDGGATWREQAATGAALTAGSAVSPTVCWAAGRAGAVWRTTDGEHWQAATPPASADLTRITATDAAHAEVTAADGRRYETADGGLTWTPAGT